MLNNTVKEIMLTGENIPKVHKDTLFRQALEELTRVRKGGVVVVDSEDKVIDVITDGDIKRIILHNEDPLPALYMHDVKDFIKERDILALTPKTTIRDALVAMVEKGVWCTPVVEDGKLVGFFQMRALLRKVIEDPALKK